MTATHKPIRQSVTLPGEVAERVRALAKRRRTSASRVLADLIEVGLDEADRRRQLFHALVESLAQSSDPTEHADLKEQLARLTFGE